MQNKSKKISQKITTIHDTWRAIIVGVLVTVMTGGMLLFLEGQQAGDLKSFLSLENIQTENLNAEIQVNPLRTGSKESVKKAIGEVKKSINDLKEQVIELRKFATKIDSLTGVNFNQKAYEEIQKKYSEQSRQTISALRGLSSSYVAYKIALVGGRNEFKDQIKEINQDYSYIQRQYRAVQDDLVNLRQRFGDNRVNDFLGKGFGDGKQGITRYSDASNESLARRGAAFREPGVGEINSVFYNVKDYFKYITGALAILWLMISAFRLVSAGSDESIQAAKKGIIWSLVGLVAIFMIDIMVVAFFEGGALGTPGESLVKISHEYKDGKTQIGYNLEKSATSALFRNIADYFTKDIRALFKWLKVIAGATAVLMIFAVGLWMVNAAGNEEAIEKGKKYLVHIITAFVTLLMLDVLIFQGIYPENRLEVKEFDQMTGEWETVVYVTTTPECVEYLKDVDTRNPDFSILPKLSYIDPVTKQSATIDCAHSAASISKLVSNSYILGVVRFFETIMGGIAVFFIVYGGIRIISSFGNTETVDKSKKQVIWALGGLVVILFADNAVRRFFFVTDYKAGTVSTNIQQGFVDLAGVVNFAATFIGVFSLVAILLAGIIWVANFGNQEIGDKAKKTIIGAIIGIVLSSSAFAIVNSITDLRSNDGSGVDINVNTSR